MGRGNTLGIGETEKPVLMAGSRRCIGRLFTSFNSSSLDHNVKPETTGLTERKAEYGLAYVVYMRFAEKMESVTVSG